MDIKSTDEGARFGSTLRLEAKKILNSKEFGESAGLQDELKLPAEEFSTAESLFVISWDDRNAVRQVVYRRPS